MEWLDFDFEADYSNNKIIIHLKHSIQPDGHRWPKKTTLLTRRVPISNWLNSPSSLLDRVLIAQIGMLKWYEKNKKLLDAIEMMFVNGREMRIQMADLKKKDFYEKIIRY